MNATDATFFGNTAGCFGHAGKECNALAAGGAFVVENLGLSGKGSINVTGANFTSNTAKYVRRAAHPFLSPSPDSREQIGGAGVVTAGATAIAAGNTSFVGNVANVRWPGALWCAHR